MPRDLVHPAELYVDVPYSYAGIAPPGSIVFTAGACPLDANGELVGAGDFTAQARRALENLVVALDAAGCGLDDIVKTTVYVASADTADLRVVWEEVEEVFGTEGPPATLLGVAALGWPEQLVEIEAIAARSG